MMTGKQPIGVFDSGYGGLTILDEFIKQIPEYDFLYLGDNARTPYGTRSFDVVYDYTLEAVKKMFDMGCHLVILACNTASSKALRTIQQKDLPNIDPNKRVLGVIRPSVEVVNQYTKTNHVGVFGTSGTVSSKSYPIEIEKLHPSIRVVQEACPMWVPIVENNEIETPGADYFVQKHVNSLMTKDDKIDTIILGCTHYPLLKTIIEKYLPSHVRVLSQGEIIANSLKDYLKRHPEIDEHCSKNSSHTFYTTEYPETFNNKTSLFLKQEVKAERIVL